MELKCEESYLERPSASQTHLFCDSIKSEGERRVDDDLQARDHDDGSTVVSDLPENLRHCGAERVLLDRVGRLQQRLSRINFPFSKIPPGLSPTYSLV